jgi:adenine/guanine phosphoribosyltransferase-like PRPP-binding protein
MEPHEFWQEILPGDYASPGPYQDRFPARLPDGRVLFLPIRRLGETGRGIASLILNQTAFAVEAVMADLLAEQLAEYAPEVIVGMPTLGLSLARAVAQRLGHKRYVALGTSRKFWYDEDLSVPLTSITSPGAQKRLYLDPRMRPLLMGKRVCLIDDVISSGTSISAGLDLLQGADLRPVCVAAAMLQTRRWQDPLGSRGALAVGVIRSPLLQVCDGGWDLAEE